ncbi:hypothetical protein HS088_TW03G00399 [Tripterygium wilfordii]|uniref:Uncharacterized protein n=1 Tax=Tripterygium wilfordii TaxID=458696 RepID=A0A7J7DUS5_TRIWF|nr:hypothetical protein HS088_TW03G00399 [Tripterygium wilfordii]
MVHTAGSKSFARLMAEKEIMLEKLSQTPDSIEQPPESVAWEGDVYCQVMGPGRNGRMRGVGLGPTVTSLWRFLMHPVLLIKNEWRSCDVRLVHPCLCYKFWRCGALAPCLQGLDFGTLGMVMVLFKVCIFVLLHILQGTRFVGMVMVLFEVCILCYYIFCRVWICGHDYGFVITYFCVFFWSY